MPNTQEKPKTPSYFWAGTGIVSVFILLFLGSLFLRQAEAQQNTGDQLRDLEGKIEVFFDSILSKSNTGKALEDLVLNGPLDAGSEGIAEMRAKIDGIEAQCGSPVSYEKIDDRIVGGDLVLIRYLLKCESHPMVFTFTFYRQPLPLGQTTSMPSSWHVIGFRFDSNLDVLLLR